MYSPTTRLLTVLELLQSRTNVSGVELAETLEVEVRSVRRYVTMLRDMGIPVESEKGRYGSYSLRPGYRLPPLMFNESEILAVILGLMAVKRLGMATGGGSESASTKVLRVLPDDLRDRVRAFQGVLTLDMPAYQAVSEEVLAQFSLGAYQRLRLWVQYLGGSRGSATERAIDVYGLVYRTGFWYAVAYCHLRQDLRVFRLDRVRRIRLLEDSFTPPPDLDTLEYLNEFVQDNPRLLGCRSLVQSQAGSGRASRQSFGRHARSRAGRRALSLLCGWPGMDGTFLDWYRDEIYRTPTARTARQTARNRPVDFAHG